MDKNNNLLFPIIAGILLIGGSGIAYFSNPQPVIAPSSTQETQQNSSEKTQQTQATQTQQQEPPKTSRDLVKSCTTDMATQFHIHQHLVVLIEQKPVSIPANIGIDITKNCMSPIHTHDVGGIVHVESPVKSDFVLSDFFYNWGLPFTKNQFGDYKVDKDHGLKFYVNGKESGAFENLLLEDKQEIVIDYYKLSEGPTKLPPAFQW